MQTILKPITLSDGSTAYNVVVFADGKEITFGVDNDVNGLALIDILKTHVAWIEVD